MATPIGDTIPLTGNALIDGLTQGSSWDFDGGPHTLTYSLDVAFDTDLPPGTWTPAWTGSVAEAFATWAAVANVQFMLLGDPGTQLQNQSTADIALALETLGQQLPGRQLIGLGIFPDPVVADQLLSDVGYARHSGDFPFPRPEGDIVFLSDQQAFGLLGAGGAGFGTIIHEIGHALGLKHPHDDGGNARPTFAELGISSHDTQLYSVMSYAASSSSLSSGRAATPMPLDILAIQHIYGANMSYHAGDDTYTLAGSGVMRTIWDAGGTDTLNASSLSLGISMDLRAGGVTNHGSGSTTAIAYNVTIENAIGTNFNDTIVGNDAANVIDGRGGVDTLIGGLGNDTLVEGAGNDILDGGAGVDTALYSGNRVANTITKTTSGYTVSGPDGSDTLSNIERLQFSDTKVALDLDLGAAAGNTVRIIGAAFDTPAIQQHPDWVGTGLSFFDSGMSMLAVSELMAPILGLSNTAFVNTVYQNVVNAPPSQGERDYYVGLLVGSGGTMSQAELLVLAANVDANEVNINLVGLQQSGVEFA